MAHSGFFRPWTAALALSLAFLGCSPTRETARATDDGVAAIQFSDIPVPDGLVLQERHHRSDSLENGSYRYANFLYEGTTPVARVGDYMRERMPHHAWVLRDQRSDPAGDGETLKFERGRYVAECTISRRDALTTMAVEVRSRIEQKD